MKFKYSKDAKRNTRKPLPGMEKVQKLMLEDPAGFDLYLVNKAEARRKEEERLFKRSFQLIEQNQLNRTQPTETAIEIDSQLYNKISADLHYVESHIVRDGQVELTSSKADLHGRSRYSRTYLSNQRRSTKRQRIQKADVKKLLPQFDSKQ